MRDRARRVLGAALLVAGVALVYAPSLDHGFVWDDDAYVQNNRTLRSAAGLREIWFDLGATPQYYPLVHTTFWAEHQLWGQDPRGYHAVNVALHAAAAVLLWRLLVLLAVPGAWLAAAVFALHPVHVESVAWVTERKNVLSLVCALGSLLAYLRACPPEAEPGTRPAPRCYALAFALYGAALLAKTVTASVPAVLLVIAAWKRGRLVFRDALWLVPFFVVGLALSSITLWMERTHVGAAGSDWDFSLAERVLIAGRAVWFYAGKLAWPDPLVFFYPRWEIDAAVGWQWLFPAAAAGVVAALWGARRRIGRGPLAAVLVFGGVLVPALGFFDVLPFRYSFVADHFQYHASIGLIALAAAAGTLAGRRLGPRASRAAPFLAAAALLALGAKARSQVHAYRDLPTLYASVIAANPGSWTAHNNLGRYLQNQGRYEEAVVHLREAIALRPDLSRIRNNLGSSLSSLGRLDEAAAELESAFAGVGEVTDQAETHVYLAVVRIRQGRFPEAVGLLETALELRPDDKWALYNLGVARAGGGDLAAGAAQVREALALDPAFALGHHELGSMVLALGDVRGALPAFEEAVRLEPENAAYRTDLGAALLRSGDLDGGERELRTAAELDPGSTEAGSWLRIHEELRRNRDGSNPPPAP